MNEIDPEPVNRDPIPMNRDPSPTSERRKEGLRQRERERLKKEKLAKPVRNLQNS